MKTFGNRVLAGLMIALPFLMILVAVGRYQNRIKKEPADLVMNLILGVNMSLSVYSILNRNSSAVSASELLS